MRKVQKQYRMKKELKLSAMTSVLKGRNATRKQRWNGPMLTTQERMVRRPQRCKGGNHLRLNAFTNMQMESAFYLERDGMGHLNESLLDRINQQTPQWTKWKDGGREGNSNMYENGFEIFAVSFEEGKILTQSGRCFCFFFSPALQCFPFLEYFAYEESSWI